MPRPTRTLRWREPRGGRSDSSPTDFFSAAFFFAMNLVHHFHEMAHFVDHAASFRRVPALDNLIEAAQAEPANCLAHVVRAADKADHPFDLDCAPGGVFLLCRHRASPAAC